MNSRKIQMGRPLMCANNASERKRLWSNVLRAKEQFRQVLIDSKGEITDEKYYYHRELYRQAIKEWDAYVEGVDSKPFK